MTAPLPPVVAVVGPTAAGKSRFAVEVALRLGGEVLSCDSMQVYRGLDVGTDKIAPADRCSVPHHLLDVAEPGAYFSAGAFRALALEVLSDIARRNRVAVLVGGTGLYYRALVMGLADAPPRDEALRSRLVEKVRQRGPERLHRVLRRLDPLHAAGVLPGDALRIVRALEVRLASGIPLGEWIRRSPFGARPLPLVLKVGLTAPRAVLYDRINRRVEVMLASGWLAEVARLKRDEVLRGPVAKAIGYGEISAFLDGSLSWEEVVRRIQTRSRNLAKRQWAWFSREAGIQWYDTDKENWNDNAIRCIEDRLEEARRGKGDQHPEHDPELRPKRAGAHHDLPGER